MCHRFLPSSLGCPKDGCYHVVIPGRERWAEGNVSLWTGAPRACVETCSEQAYVKHKHSSHLKGITNRFILEANTGTTVFEHRFGLLMSITVTTAWSFHNNRSASLIKASERYIGINIRYLMIMTSNESKHNKALSKWTIFQFNRRNVH